MTIENVTKIMLESNLADIGFWIQVIAAGVIGVLIWQVWEFRKQNRLAYNPFITPRVGMLGQIPILQLWNVGNGSAINIELELSDEDSNESLEHVRMFAFKKEEVRDTNVSFSDHSRIRIKGSYQNIGKDKISINLVADYNELRAYH